MSILVIHPGAYYHIESLEAPRYAQYFDKLARPEEIEGLILEDYDVILVPCRTPADRLIRYGGLFQNYLDHGGTIVATGESRSDLWLPGFSFHEQPTNYWWWLEKEGDLGVQIARPDHTMFDHVDSEALTWHLHGWLEPAECAEVIATNAEGGAILVIDEVTTRGRMVLTTLDPFYHHGSHFMPATTRFLDGFLPWIREAFDTKMRKPA